MRVLKKSFMSACIALALVLMLPSMNVYAESSSETPVSGKTYTVTFRPGNVGSFTDSAISRFNVEPTKHGAIKVTVPAGSVAPGIYSSDVNAEEGYFVKDVKEWGPNGITVDRDMDFVVDYARLVDGVEYTVEFVDSASGESIAPAHIAQANKGESRTETAPAQIVISGGAVYNLTSASSITLTLDADATKNVFIFKYTMAPAGTVIEEVIIGEDGEIITTTDYVTTTINNGTTVVGGGAAAGGAGGAGGAAGGGAAEGGEAAGGNEAVEIPDEETPLAGGIGEGTEEPAGMVEIGEEDVPLASGEEPMANMALIGASVFGAGAVMLAGLWLYMKKKRVKAETTTQEE